MTVIVQQIVYTERPQRWWALSEALGLAAPYPPDTAWGEFEGNGVLAVHHAAALHPAGSADLHLLVDDLDAAQRALATFMIERSSMEGVGEVLTVSFAEGTRFTVSGGARSVPGGEMLILPIWFAADFTDPRAALEALGLHPEIIGDRGGWLTLLADGGGVALHAAGNRSAGEGAGIGLSFEASGDLDALAVRLRDAGFAATVVDESYGRTIRVPDPDGGEEIWINGVQDDLYGYHRVS